MIGAMDTPPDTDKARRPLRGNSPHFGFRLDPAIATRIEAVGAALAVRNQAMSLPAPDRSDVMRAIVLEGLPPLEGKLGIAPPPSAPPTPAAPVRAAAEHEAPKPRRAAERVPSGRGGGKATAKPGKASKSPKGAKSPKGKG